MGSVGFDRFRPAVVRRWCNAAGHLAAGPARAHRQHLDPEATMACSARIELELTPADLRRLAEVEAGLRQRTPLGEVPYPALAGMLLRRGLEDYEAELRALEPRQTLSAPA
jgi:hypothetical protein